MTLSTDAAASNHETTQNVHVDDVQRGETGSNHEERHAAARVIQRHYRGYRMRRRMSGMELDASTRWMDAINEARYRRATAPTSRAERADEWEKLGHTESHRDSDFAQANWKRVTEVAKRAGEDDHSPSSDSETDLAHMTASQRDQRRRARAQARQEREKNSKMMDLPYFLEMVDTKHRYGSNLRAYHEVWKKAETRENFFYWLDHGEGLAVEVPTVSRVQLGKEQVRYLSREERMNYLVKIDEEGRVRWAKMGERVWTTANWRDSLGGIVSTEDKVSPMFQSYDETPIGGSRASTSSASSSGGSAMSGQGEHYTNDEFSKTKGLTKYTKVSAATIFNHLLRTTIKPGSWIFVADTSFRLYIGLKQSGSFQHSSFLHGSRISAAGLIKIKDGQIRRLSPLSGHYRPPTANFRAFVHSLRDAGADMSRVSISRSYAVLVGLEAYVRTRRQLKHGIQHLEEGVVRVVHPEEARKREEMGKDKSRSAEKERAHIRREEEREVERRKENSTRYQLVERIASLGVDDGVGVGTGKDTTEGDRSSNPKGREESRHI